MDSLTRMTIGLLVLACAVAAVHAQPLENGSAGADGALVLTRAGTVLFNPQAFNPPLNPSGDNVYHFTSIYIAKDVTVHLTSKNFQSPLFWLSQGSVQIDGIIDLNGGDGTPTPSIAGAGGYPGASPRRAGYYPEGFTPNVFLVPLVGGRGGDGGITQGGGAGGGALLLASSTSITINGAITANGGASSDGRGGGGGAIRLVAPAIEGSGLVMAKGGSPGGPDGFVRFETLDNRFSGNLSNTPHGQGKPFGLFLPPSPQGSVRVVSVGNTAVRSQEFKISQAAPVSVVIEARYIPPGTVVQLEFFPENGPSRVVETTPLEGTFQLSRATASITISGRSSSVQVRAVWKHPPLQGENQR
jgi:hypothetical protein